MSAVTVTASTSPTTPLGRVWRIVKLITANPATVIGWPVAILGAIFVMNWTIWWLIFINLDATQSSDAAAGIQYNGAVSFVFVYMMIVAVQALNLTFPLALGYGSTRRSFSQGAILAFVLLAIGYASIMTLGAWIEELTGGWGLDGSFFRTLYFASQDGWFAQWWIYFCWLVFFLFTGTIFAAMYVRWKATGLIVSFGILGILVVGAIAIVTFTDAWGSFWQALADLGTLGVASAALIPAVLGAVLGYLVLSRATPRG